MLTVEDQFVIHEKHFHDIDWRVNGPEKIRHFRAAIDIFRHAPNVDLEDRLGEMAEIVSDFFVSKGMRNSPFTLKLSRTLEAYKQAIRKRGWTGAVPKGKGAPAEGRVRPKSLAADQTPLSD
ncbi:MAG: hypothetical protein AB7T14_04005 [Candidatus Methylacidiphilaceae bacterium]